MKRLLTGPLQYSRAIFPARLYSSFADIAPVTLVFAMSNAHPERQILDASIQVR